MVDVVALLMSGKIPYSTELDMQEGILRLLTKAGVAFEREKTLSAKDRVDFLVEGGVAVECKIKGQPMSVFRQLKRYAESPEVNVIVLFTGTHMGLPTQINGKPTFLIKAGTSWL